MSNSTNTIADLSEFCGWRSEGKPWAKLPGIEIAPESKHHEAMPLRFNGGIGCVADLMRVRK